MSTGSAADIPEDDDGPAGLESEALPNPPGPDTDETEAEAGNEEELAEEAVELAVVRSVIRRLFNAAWCPVLVTRVVMAAVS